MSRHGSDGFEPLISKQREPGMNRLLTTMTLALLIAPAHAQDAPIVHDAEYYILQAQNGEKWAEEDKK